MNNPSSNPHKRPPFSSEAQAESLRLYCITEGCVRWRLRSSPWGRADGIETTALKIEGVKGTPGPPDKRTAKGVRDTPENRPHTTIGG
jgi:hypothetical protein